MRRISWITALGAMLLTACVVESSAVSPPSGAEASTAPQAVTSSDDPLEAQSSALPDDNAQGAPSAVNQCREFCPGEACCFGGPHVGWLCC